MTTITYEEWVDKFRPIQNELSDDASFEGMMFETYGDELDHVLQVARETNGLLVWTYIDGENGTYIVEGYRLVNRIGYFVTEREWELGATINIEVTDGDVFA